MRLIASFERLFSLSKKTGDRLIVFDSATGDGFAAIPIDEYEKMVTDPRDITSLTGDQLIEQINRDIGHWRESQEDRDDFLDMFGSAESMPDEEDSWEHAGDLLHDRYMFEEHDLDEDDDFFVDDHSVGMPFVPPVLPREEGSIAFDFDHGDVLPEEEAPRIEPLGQRPIPPGIHESEGMWEEEPLDEDPVFFEEPVE